MSAFRPPGVEPLKWPLRLIPRFPARAEHNVERKTGEERGREIASLSFTRTSFMFCSHYRQIMLRYGYDSKSHYTVDIHCRYPQYSSKYLGYTQTTEKRRRAAEGASSTIKVFLHLGHLKRDTHTRSFVFSFQIVFLVSLPLFFFFPYFLCLC